MGIYVPSSHEYVKKKMNKINRSAEIIDADLRFQMLRRMSEDDPELSVDDQEYYLIEKSRTYNTMIHFKEKYPDAELYFLAGGDKIDIFPRWYRIKDFLEQFPIIVTNREDYNAEVAFQAQKCMSDEEMICFAEFDASKTKNYGKAG